MLIHLGLRRERSDWSKSCVSFIIFRGKRAQALRKNPEGSANAVKSRPTVLFFVRAATADLAY